MDIPGREITKVGSSIRDEKPNPVRVACAIRGMLDDVIEGVGESASIRNFRSVSSQEPGLVWKVARTVESVTTFSHQAKLMDVALWSRLPEELQELIFARLPWPQIYRVRVLSRGWNRKLMSGAKDSEFKRACVRAQFKLFALLEPRAGQCSFTVNMFDIASNRWHAFETSLRSFPKCEDYIFIEGLSASDGGLVCFLSKLRSRVSKQPRWAVFVCNPLTGAWKQLPPLHDIVQQRIMVQLIMDRETKHYRVLVVGYGRVRSVVNIYHSETGQWTNVDGSSSGEVVYGTFYTSKFDGFKPAPWSCNLADGLVHEIGTTIPGNFAHESIFVKDHLFCLKDVGPAGGLQTHCIEEYHAVNCGASWIPLKEYPLNRLPSNPHIKPDDVSWSPDIFACKDFLLLFLFNEMGEENLREFLFIYQFSEDEWRELPRVPGGYELLHAQQQMCELCFDSVP